jgi:ankyrin repeat protein
MAEETLAHLLKAGAKVSGMDSQGRTPLHIAAKFDNVRAAEILIKEGAKVMPRDRTGKTPLDYAESAPMIMLLKQNGATEH